MVTQTTHAATPIDMLTQQDGVSGQVTLVRFEINGLAYAISLEHVAAVMRSTAMQPSRAAANSIWIGQIRSTRGNILVASGHVLGGALDPQAFSRVIVFRGEIPIALGVEKVLSSRIVEQDAIVHFPHEMQAALGKALVTGIVWDAGGDIDQVLDADRLANEVNGVAGNARFLEGKNVGQSDALSRLYTGVEYRQSLEVRFQGSSDRWLLPVAVIRHVTNMPSPHHLHGAPQSVVGILAWRRTPILVIDPTYQLNIAERPGMNGKLVVIGDPAATDRASDRAFFALQVSEIIGLQSNLQVAENSASSPDGDQFRLINLAAFLRRSD